MEAQKVNKFGRTYRTGTQAVQARCEQLLFFKKSLPERTAGCLENTDTHVQLVKRDIGPDYMSRA